MSHETDDALRQEILSALQGGSMNAVELLKHCPTAADRVQVANRLFAMKTAGQVVAVARGVYRLATDNDPPSKEPPAERRQKPRGVPRLEAVMAVPKVTNSHTSKPSAGTEAILRKLINDTQEALDAYLLSVGDPQIIAPLKAARDHARAALTHLTHGEAA